MKTLAEVCRDLTASLEQAGKAVEATVVELARFEKDAASWPVTWITLSLQLVSSQVAAEAAQLSQKHNGTGSVCITTWHDGNISVAWLLDESLLPDYEKAWEATVTRLPLGQFLTFMEQLLQQLHDGDWEPAVRWLQAHRK